MDGLLFAVNAVLPVFLIIALGAAVRAGRILNDEAVERLSRLVYNTALPVLVFQVVGKAEILTVWNGRCAAAFVAAVLISVALAWAVGRLMGMDAVQTGTFVQVSYRANTVIVGLAVLQSAYGDAVLGPAGVMAGVSVALFNVLAVIVLTLPHHSGGGLRGAGAMLRQLLVNPLILGMLAGVGWSLLRSRTGWSMPAVLDRPLDWLQDMALPLALIAVGASLRLDAARRVLLPALSSATIKLLVQPLLALGLLALAGVSGMDRTVCLLYLASPTAVASYIMVRAMKGDAEMASQTVTLSTAASVLTTAGWLLVAEWIDPVRRLGAG